MFAHNRDYIYSSIQYVLGSIARVSRVRMEKYADKQTPEYIPLFSPIGNNNVSINRRQCTVCTCPPYSYYGQ